MNETDNPDVHLYLYLAKQDVQQALKKAKRCLLIYEQSQSQQPTIVLRINSIKKAIAWLEAMAF